MYLRSDERGPAMNNRLALRIAVFGGFAVVLFAVLFFRLWLLQVLDGEKYLAEAKNNRTRSYRVSAPRGEILDRSGKVLVANRTSLALQVNPRKLPADPARRRAEIAQLAELDPQHPPSAAPHDAQGTDACARGAGDPAPRRRPLPRLLPAGKPGPLSRRRGADGLRPATTRTGRWPLTCSAASARSPKNS